MRGAGCRAARGMRFSCRRLPRAASGSFCGTRAPAEPSMSEQVTADQVTEGPAVVTVTFVPTVDDQIRANREVTSTRWSRFFAIAAPVMMGVMMVLVVLTDGW